MKTNHFCILFIVTFLLVTISAALADTEDKKEIAVTGEFNKTERSSAETSDVDSRFPAFPIYGNWTVYTVEDGLPSNKINAVKIDGERVLVGTDQGLAVLENGVWRVYNTDEGLAHRNVISLDVNETTGDVWIGTMSGLNRWSAGIFERFDQFNSGLANDVVYEVQADERYVWIATAAGANRYDSYTGQWKIFNEESSPMHEPWTYGITYADDRAWIAAWGGGVLEFNNETEQFRVYRDPDGHFQISLFPDDGLVHDITTGVAYDQGILWVSTYFGLSRYNGQRWWGFFDHNSGLSSNFVNAVKAKYGIGYMATDDGFNTSDGTVWVSYHHGETRITVGETKRIIRSENSISHGFIWNMDVQGDEVWVATSRGLSRGEVTGYVDESILSEQLSQ